jgi:hypothetical protein
MAAARPAYRRLPGTGYRYTIPGWTMFLLFFVLGIFVLLFRGRRVQLWQGEEHLLLVEWDGNREYYKRFGYGDIQAFIVHKTPEAAIVNAVLLAVFGLLLVLGLISSDAVGRVTLLALAGIFGVLLLSNFLSGPSCQCMVQTAVQVEELPSLRRLPRAQKVLARLRPLIAQAQGQLAPEELPARMQEWRASNTRGATASGVAPQVTVDEPDLPPRILSQEEREV